jgi:hypothetical protein
MKFCHKSKDVIPFPKKKEDHKKKNREERSASFCRVIQVYTVAHPACDVGKHVSD